MTRGQKTAGIILGGLFAGTMLLGACGTTAQTASTNDTKMLNIDGVQCVVYDSGSYAGGISCNWEEFNKGNN